MKQFYNARDISELAGISESKSYCLIRQMNDELQQAGYLTIRGKVPASYARKRFSLEENANECAE